MASPAASEWEVLLSSLSSGGGVDQLRGSATPGQRPALVAAVRAGRYLQALASPQAAALLADCDRLPEAAVAASGSDQEEAEELYARLRSRLHAALDAASDDERHAKRSEMLIVGVAVLYVFIQANITGPSPTTAPASPIEAAAGVVGAAGTVGTTQRAAGGSPAARFDYWARQQLCTDGEEMIGKFALPQYLLVARALLVEPEVSTFSAATVAATAAPGATLDTALAAEAAAARNSSMITTAAWWAARTVLLQQRLLAKRSPSLRASLLPLFARTLRTFDAPPPPAISASLWSQLAAAANLEAAMMEHTCANPASAERLLSKAAAAMQVQLELTGMLGKRTVHQVDAKAQMVVVPKRATEVEWLDTDDDEDDEGDGDGERDDIMDGQAMSELADTMAELAQVEAAEEQGGGGDGTKKKDSLKGLAFEGVTGLSDILPRAALEGDDAEAATAIRLRSVEQAYCLAACITFKKAKGADDLAAWTMQPYVDAVTAHADAHARPMLQATCHLLTARHERERPRTRERAMLLMEQLVDGFHAPQPSVAARVRYVFAVWFPPQLLLRKEWGECLIRMGILGPALACFEELELWDNLIYCYRLLDKQAQAMALIKTRLEETPDDPRLWCALGDLTKDDAHFVTAWERSHRRHARAKRSLARSAAKRDDWEAAAAHWEAALAVNALDADGWFANGYALLKSLRYDAALASFTRVAQLEPEHAQAWNNIAALCLRTERWRPGFKALQEALKYSREQWQSWDNLATVAAQLGEWNTLLQAMDRVLELTQNERFDLPPLSALLHFLQTQQPEAGWTEGARQSEAAETEEDTTAAAVEAAAAAAAAAGGTAAPVDYAWGWEEVGDVESEDAAGEAGVRASECEATSQFMHTERSRALLCDRLDALLKKVAPTKAATPAFWGAFARFHTLMGRRATALESLVKQCRGLQTTKWQSDETAFATFAEASLALGDAYLAEAAAASAARSKGAEAAAVKEDVRLVVAGAKELAAARMHLRQVVKMSERCFSDAPLFTQLQGCLAQVEAAEAAVSAR